MDVSTTSTVDPINMYDYINNLIFNPIILIGILIIIIIGYILVFSSLGNSTGTSMSSMSNYASSDSSSANKGQKIIIFMKKMILMKLYMINY